MKRALQEKLLEDFPKLYRGRHMSIMENLMPFGFEVGDGWFDLLYTLSQRLAQVSPDTLAVQVKEKFGGLRFYADQVTREGDEAICKAEAEAIKTCEWCGAPGEPGGIGWIVTLCDPCRKSREEQKDASNHN